MLGRRELPREFSAWNARWGAPFGRHELVHRVITARAPRLARRSLSIHGPFGVQDNNDTRRVEYPWAFHATAVKPGMSVVELGGSLAGFQFVLAKSGAHVTNVDPGEDATGVGWPCTQANIDRMNRAFRTDVRLVSATLADAGIPDESIDTIYSISTVEHIPEAELANLAVDMRRILRPGGHIVLTIDLFLDLAPFTSRTQNRYGCNIDVKRFVDQLDCVLVAGEEDELNGYPTFDADRVLSGLSELLYGSGYPACAQLLMLRKPSS